MQRVFVGIQASTELQSSIGEWQSEHKSLSAKWIPPPDLHITLIPPWDEEDCGQIGRSLKDLAHTLNPIRIRFGSVGPGPDRQKPSLLWTLPALEDELIALREKVQLTLEKNSTQLFQPHITVARLDQSTRMIPDEVAVNWQEIVNNVTLFATSGGGSGYTLVTHITF